MKGYNYIKDKNYPSLGERMVKAYSNPNSKLNQANRANVKTFNAFKFWFFVLWTLFFGAMFIAANYFPQWYTDGSLRCVGQFLGMSCGVFGLVKIFQVLVPDVRGE
mgnify:CR=1 FL=1